MHDQLDQLNESTEAPGKTQPGLERLREAVARYTPWRLPSRATRRADALAGLNVTITSVPDGMANGMLVGVNPIFGLYATMAGPLVGGLLTRTQLMVITTTSVASLTAAQALAPLPAENRTGALFVMVVLAGVIQAVLGLTNAARMMRFVSYSVTTGFLTGVAVLLILSQLPTVTAVEVAGTNRVMQTLDLLFKLGDVDVASLGVAALAIVFASSFSGTRLQGVGRLLAVVVPSAMVALLGLDSVRTVSDIGPITRGFPMPTMPALGDTFDMLTGAFAIAVITLVQATGISQSIPDPDFSRRNISRDFIAQGAANIVSGFFRGLPVGGSVSSTAINVAAGARTRWASVAAGVWMILIVVGAPTLVGYVAMPALGALLVLAGFGSLRWHEIKAVWYTRPETRLAAGTTFLAMLFLPVQAAVGIGVVLSMLMFVRESSADVNVVQLTRRADGALEELAAPRVLPGRSITVLQVYGDLFYGGAHTLSDRLPSPRAAERPVVVLLLRGRTRIGSTLIDVLTRYANQLNAAGGKLYLAGVSPNGARSVTESAKLRQAGVAVFLATPVLGESMQNAIAHAQEWLQKQP